MHEAEPLKLEEGFDLHMPTQIENLRFLLLRCCEAIILKRLFPSNAVPNSPFSIIHYCSLSSSEVFLSADGFSEFKFSGHWSWNVYSDLR
jgi:hypothetical protein